VLSNEEEIDIDDIFDISTMERKKERKKERKEGRKKER